MCVLTSRFAHASSPIYQMSTFHPLALVDRSSETQLQGGAKLNYLI